MMLPLEEEPTPGRLLAYAELEDATPSTGRLRLPMAEVPVKEEEEDDEED